MRIYRPRAADLGKDKAVAVIYSDQLSADLSDIQRILLYLYLRWRDRAVYPCSNWPDKQDYCGCTAGSKNSIDLYTVEQRREYLQYQSVTADNTLDIVSAEFYYTGRFQLIAEINRDTVDRQQQFRGVRNTTDLEDNRGNSLKKPADCPVYRPGYLCKSCLFREKTDIILTVAGIYRHGQYSQIYTAMAADCGIYCIYTDSPQRRAGEEIFFI